MHKKGSLTPCIASTHNLLGQTSCSFLYKNPPSKLSILCLMITIIFFSLLILSGNNSSENFLIYCIYDTSCGYWTIRPKTLCIGAIFTSAGLLCAIKGPNLKRYKIGTIFSEHIFVISQVKHSLYLG